MLLANSTHTPQDQHLTRQKPRTPYATFVRIVTPIAPEDGRVSPKHAELKELKANKYFNCIKLVIYFIIKTKMQGTTNQIIKLL